MNRKMGLFLFLAFIPLVLAFALPQRVAHEPAHKKLVGTYAAKTKPAVDHSKFAQLQVDFKTPQQVTAACISCHNQRHQEVMASSHWNWGRKEYIKGKGIVALGKSNVLNNFCIGASGNEQSCAKCHIGYGAERKDFDYKNPLNVDCLACHDTTGTFVKGNAMGGMPDPKVSLKLVATHVGRPTRYNCGSCHFMGGGGNNVKHGDLEMAMMEPNKDLDVHMAVEGSSMQCVDCHTADKHKMQGKVYSIASMNSDRVECQSCHGALPHKDSMINEHMEKVSCQSCHIPTYAKENPTKLHWDWSTAGKLKDGKPYAEEGPDGKESYLSIKGSFTWGKNLEPDYVWFNGTADHYLLGDKVEDPSKPVVMNQLLGSYNDPDSKITPVKIHTAKVPYDPVNKILIEPKTFSAQKGDGGYWKDFDWVKAAEKGMEHVGQPFSGKVDFIETKMYWPINHMVSSKDKTVACAECHTRSDGRLAKVGGFYLPGRDRNGLVDGIGSFLIYASLLGITLHGVLRIASHFLGKGGNNV